MTEATDARRALAELAHRLAPWPKTEDEATAEALTRYYLVRAQVAYIRNQEMPLGAAGSPESAVWIEACLRFVDRWVAAALLRALIVVADAVTADVTARNIWADVDDGGSAAEWLWEWLQERRLEPEAITAAVKAAMAGVTA